MEKIVGSALELSLRKDFLIGHVQIKTYGLQTLFLLFNIKNRKCFGSAFPIPPNRNQANLFAYSCCITLHTSSGMLDQRGEGCQNANKQFITKSHRVIILYKPVAKYQFTMSCIQYVVVIHLSEQATLIELETEQV